MDNMLNALSLIGPLSIGFMLVVLGVLSKRLGEVTHAKPYYMGLHVAGALMFLATIVRLINIRLAQNATIDDNMVWSVIYNGLIVSAITLGLVIAWRYWSWLIAERD